MPLNRIILVSNTDWYLYNFRLSLAQYLRAQGCEVLLVSPEGHYAAALQEQGFRWLPWKLGRQTLAPWRELGALRQLERLYRRLRPDLVHQHTVKPVLYGSLAARLAGVPAIVNSVTGLGYVYLSRTAKARLLRPLVTRFYRLALNQALKARPAVIFENASDRQFFIEQRIISTERSWLIEGVGVDPRRFTPQPEPEGAPVVLFAGRLLWDKGLGVLVEAARLLHRQIAAARVVLVGEPDPGNPATVDEATLRAWQAEGAVEWWGWRADMPAVYAGSQVVVLPSLGEGVPTTLLEAAACGRPIVASDVPGCRAIVTPGENGLLVPPNDPQALAQALATLLADPALRGRMGAGGRQAILAKFTIEQINAATLAVYRTLVA
jgi:glycosyltransferase involved in cell wall biosynthesis